MSRRADARGRRERGRAPQHDRGSTGLRTGHAVAHHGRDTSPESLLAIDRFDGATDGTINYERNGVFETADGVAEAIAKGQGVVVIHGVDYNEDGTYSGDVMSDLAPSLPTEATDPALCGVLETN